MNDLAGKHVVIAGGSGFVGLSLAEYLIAAKARVTILSRSQPYGSFSVQHEKWDGRSAGSWVTALNDCDALVNVAGRTVNCVKTPDHCDEILRSRVESTLVLGEALRQIANPPPVWVQMSTAHIYGDPPVAECVEESPPGYGLAPTVAQAWEDAFTKAVIPSQRSVVLRTSFVIGRDRGAGGGALATLRLVTKLGLGGRVGRGAQGLSWLHEADMNGIFHRALTQESMKGIYIASSPNPVSQVEFMRTLRRQLRMPIGLPATEWMVRIGAPLVLRTDPELVLYGRYVKPQRLLEEGFEFHFPQLESALADLC